MKNILFSLLFCSCLKTYSQTPLHTGIWRAEIQTKGGALPFGLIIKKNSNQSYAVWVVNARERLLMDTSFVSNDSLHIPMAVFDAEIVAKIQANTLVGSWKKRRTAKEIIQLPFVATFGATHRFIADAPTARHTISGKWATTFISETDTTQAVGIFEQKGNRISGTFLTTTGDYRFLDGNIHSDSLYLSTFDGTHAFLFKALVGNNLLEGKFYSGVSGLEKMIARKDDKASLPDASSLTFLKKGVETLSFSFPDLNGRSVSLADSSFKNKVVVVQVLGSWCPNCMDESLFLANYYKKNSSKGLRIIGLAFEKTTDLATAAPKLAHMKKRFGITYPVLLAGQNTKVSASMALPMLNQVTAFPTSIVLDKQGNVRYIHTGFAGPGTGKYYDTFVQKFDLLITKLLAEK